MNEETRLRTKMEELKSLNVELNECLNASSPSAVGFEISSVLETEEEQVIRQDIREFSVSKLVGENAVKKCTEFWSYYYKDDGYSTKFVDRMPGLVSINKNQSETMELVSQINIVKDEFAQIVRGKFLDSMRTTSQRHEFIHEVFPRIMTEHVYRKIHVIEEQVTNTWFNWVSRPVPKKKDVDELKGYLYNQFNRPPIGHVLAEWNQSIEDALLIIAQTPLKYTQIEKQFKVFPVMPYKFKTSTGETKRNTRNAITPFILLGQSDGQLPVYSSLDSYSSADRKKNRKKKLSGNKIRIHEALGLVGVVE